MNFVPFVCFVVQSSNDAPNRSNGRDSHHKAHDGHEVQDSHRRSVGLSSLTLPAKAGIKTRQCPPPAGGPPIWMLGLGEAQTARAATTNTMLVSTNMWLVASITAWVVVR